VAAKVTDAILGFSNEAAIEDEDTGRPMRFFAVDYKRDFEFVRKIDEYFDPRLGSKKVKTKTAGE